MAAFLCLLLLLGLFRGSNAWPLAGAESGKQGRNLLVAQDGPEPGCGKGNCGALMLSSCTWLTYPSRGRDEKSCNTNAPVPVLLNNCFGAKRSLLAYVAVVLPDNTCMRFGPGQPNGAYPNATSIGTLPLACNGAISIYAKVKTTGSPPIIVQGPKKNPPAGCKPDTATSCDTCRFNARLNCPASKVVGAGQTCRQAFLPCENAAKCAPSSQFCPPNPAKTNKKLVCRPAAPGGCDVEETCDGVHNHCPPNRFLTGTVCRAAKGDCDVAETCPGNTARCPKNAFMPATKVCRGVKGDCDMAETCTGNSAACPSNAFMPANTVCRAASGDCDVAETCSGDSAACPANGFKPADTVCRSVDGVCDVAEVCSGNSAVCPIDAFKSAAMTCRDSAGACDPAETCTGSCAACPAEAFSPSGTICRGAAGPCDVAEACTGSSPACPTDSLVPTGTVCRASTAACLKDATCTGTAGCPVNPRYTKAENQVCRPPKGFCDAPEYCSGDSDDCADVADMCVDDGRAIGEGDNAYDRPATAQLVG